MREAFAAGVLALVLASCGGSTASPSVTSPALHGEANDAKGDAIAGGGIATAPDLVHATADVAAGNITFVIQFAPGTFDRQSTRVSVLLDTDQDGSTGIRQLNALGADYSIDLSASTSQATIMKADAASCAALLTCFNAVGSQAVTFVQDGMQVIVPLSLLGNDDGRMSFQIFASILVSSSPPALPTALIVDVMPDVAAAPARVQ